MDMSIRSSAVGRDPDAVAVVQQQGPLGSFFRYICDNGTYQAYYDDLSDGEDNKIDLSKVDVR